MRLRQAIEGTEAMMKSLQQQIACRRRIRAVSGALLLASVWLAGPVHAEKGFNPAQAALDTDNSGALSPSEAPAIIQPYFAAADADKSGALSPRELHELLAQLRAPRIPDGQTPPPAPDLVPAGEAIAWSDIDAYMARMTQDLPLEGASIIVMKNGRIVHEQTFGLYDSTTQIPIASATKWLNAALIMTLVDEGKLSLDAPISTYLDWADAEKGTATLRQMLSHTGGFGPGHLADQPRSLSLEASARDAFSRPPVGPPGAQFRYGGVGMQIAAYIAEKVSGQPYAELFEQRLAGPLGMSDTYIGFAQRREPRASITNPIAAAGGYSTAADYARFLEMLSGGGEFRGRRILSQAAISEMFRDYTGRSARLGQATSVGDAGGYGIGAWCNRIEADRRCSAVQSGGAFGTSPTVLVDDKIAILLMVKDRMPLVRDHWQRITTAVLALLE